jgi:hypothetical protein
MLDSKYIESKINSLIEKQNQTNGIEKYIYLTRIFDFIASNIVTIKKEYPLLYSTSIQKAILFKIKIMEKLNQENITPYEINSYQECLTILHGFEVSLNI